MAEKDKNQVIATQPGDNPNPPDGKTYSKTEVDKMVEKAVREATGKQGQTFKLEKDNLNGKIKTLTTENTNLKGTVEGQKMEVETVNNTLDELSKDDPDKKNIARLTRDLTSAKKSVQVEKRENAAAKVEIEASRNDLDTDRREVFISKIAAEYKDSNIEALTEICDTFGVGADIDKIRKAAETKWEPLSAEPEPETPDVPVDSNDNSGGDHLSDTDYLTAYGEGKVNDHARAEKILANL